MFLSGAPRAILPGLLSLCLLYSPLSAAVSSHQTFSYAATLRMHNRERLLSKYQAKRRRQAHYIVSGTPQSKRALRQHNRELLEQHPEWFPGPLRADNHRWQELAENKAFLTSDHLQNITEVAIHRLEAQLGKPYVWEIGRAHV